MSVTIINRKAKHDYSFLKEYTAGIQLLGNEVKKIKEHGVSFTDSFCIFNNDELYLKNLHIDVENPTRERKLLLKRKELQKLQKDLDPGITIVPYKIFENERGLLKVEIVLAKGKKVHNKKESLKEKDIQRQTQKELNR
jgi:SsrA-binding protein